MDQKQETFTQIPNSLMSNKDLTDQDKLTLGLILSFTNNNKECFMGNEYLAEKMGISKNAASKRIKRLRDLGCIELEYIYREGKKEVDKRFIKLLSLTPKVSSDRLHVSSGGLQVSSDRRGGIVPQTTGYSPTDEGVSSKVGGIIQPLLNNVLDKELNNLPYKELNKEKLKLLVNKLNVKERIKEDLNFLIEGLSTVIQRQRILENQDQINKIPELAELIKFI